MSDFRREARQWLEANTPTDPPPEDGPASRDYVLAWLKKQARGGWTGIAWPKQVGGRGLSVLEQIPEKTVILGVLDLSDHAPVESVEEVANRIEAALAFIAPGRLQVAPDCGMKYLQRDAALAKLRALVAGARQVRERLV